MRPRSLFAVLLALGVTLGATAPEAQPRPPTIRPKLPPKPSKPPPRIKTKPVTPSEKPSSLKGRLGISVAQRLLKSKEGADRARGLERLGEVGTPPAIELLAKSLEPKGLAQSTPERLAAVRALASHTKSPAARQALARALSTSSFGRGDDPGEELVRTAAAAGLARSGERDALELLGKALRQEGPVAAAAANALTAHPPKDLAPVISARGAPTLALVEALEALADQRAFSSLRWLVKRAPTEVKGAAAVALTRLGDFETVELARQWRRPGHETALSVAAARILALGKDAEAPKAIAALLADPNTRDAGLELALQSPSPALLPAVDKLLAKSDPSAAPTYLAVLGRIDDSGAVTRLVSALEDAERAPSAAYALASCPADSATVALAHALVQPKTRRLAARAAIVRLKVLGERAAGLESALDSLLLSNDAADRAAGAFGHAALSPDRARTLIGRKDPVVVRAAARAAFAGPAALAAAERLAHETDPSTRTALAIALASPAAADRVPTRVLTDLIEEGGAAGPLAARALAARDDPTLRAQIELLLASGDPLVRSHVALGLERSDDPSAVGLLARRFLGEEDADVRYAIVVALSRRGEATRLRTLRLAADLDSAGRVRQAARAALAGARLSPLTSGSASFWLSLVQTAGPGHEPPKALVVPTGGLGLPVVADPDGAIALVGLPRGPVTLRLASATEPNEP